MLIAWIMRALLGSKSNQNPIVVMYGHLLDGNLKAFCDYTITVDDLPYKLYYLTIDKKVYDKFRGKYGSAILLMTRMSEMRKIVDAKCIITSHGPGLLYLLRLLCPKIHFIDVWHGTGFKNYVPAVFKQMHFYSACFVSSEDWKKIYQECRGFRENQIMVTGLAKHDVFRQADVIAQQVREKLNLTGFKYIFLFAPTWRKKEEDGEIPFGLTKEKFVNRMNSLCKRLNAVMIFRLHLNSSIHINSDDFSHLMSIPQTDYPETNRLLTCIDTLVTDWSNISADFCALDRPVVFLDTPMPAGYEQFGNTPLPMQRGGTHVRSVEELETVIEKSVGLYYPEVCEEQMKMKNFVYGNMLDGNACQRYDKEIRRLLFVK